MKGVMMGRIAILMAWVKDCKLPFKYIKGIPVEWIPEMAKMSKENLLKTEI
jgi:hypothetical protein